jgi:hypothetical protein
MMGGINARNALLAALGILILLAWMDAWAQSPGDTVGWTQYDMQTNGSSGHRIAVDDQGGVHFTWMKGAPYPTRRGTHYNFMSADGNWRWPGSGIPVSYGNRSGFPQMDVMSDGRAAIVYHNASIAGAESLFLAIDQAEGIGDFTYFHPPGRSDSGYLVWPYMKIDRSDRIHLIGHAGLSVGDLELCYTRSENGGTTWVGVQSVDTLAMASSMVTNSPVSGKVAIVYTHPFYDNTLWMNDVYYIQSPDGLFWDWVGGKINVTHYAQSPDSMKAYVDCDAVYDYNDNLHIVWNAVRLTWQGFVADTTYLFHYSTGTGVITKIAQSRPYGDWDCDLGVWNLDICKMSIGAHEPSNDLFTIYTSFDSGDCSAGAYANGDIYMQYSTDGGLSWSDKNNLTNSHTPGCVAGHCDSDNWSSLAEKVDDHLHIFYVNDKDAGAVPQTEGAATDNPMLYYRFPNPAAHVSEDSPSPREFTLSQNYPNPFNARTTIEFNLKRDCQVRLYVYDVTGALVRTLVDGHLAAGRHKAVWNAGDLASGVYCYKLLTDVGMQVRRMLLLK